LFSVSALDFPSVLSFCAGVHLGHRLSPPVHSVGYAWVFQSRLCCSPVSALPPARNSFPAKARPASCFVLPFRPTASSLISLPASRSRRLVNLVDFPLASCVDSRSGSLLRLFYCFVYFSAEKVVPDRIPCCCQVGVAPVHP
jgi:hypothetical protein